MLSFMNNKLKRKCFKIEVLIDDLIVYFTDKSESEWGKEVAEWVLFPRCDSTISWRYVCRISVCTEKALNLGKYIF